MKYQIRCTACGRAYSVDASVLGKVVKCKACGQRFAASSTTDAPLSTAEGAGDRYHSETALDTQARPGTPAQLGRFRLLDQLGEGAFGVVYRAHDPTLDREVALKVPHNHVLQSVDHRDRFVREARAAAKLRHPHIVPVYEAGEINGRHYIASAYIRGRTLQEILERKRPKLRRLVEWVADLADALDLAHRQGITHRDVKPANVMVDEHDHVLLTDFGLARLQGHDDRPLVEGSKLEDAKLTQAGTVMGTPAYMAPEQAAGLNQVVGPASDQYSLGTILYEMLCGRLPFDGPVLMVLWSILHSSPVRPRNVNPLISTELEAICLRSMNRVPGNRYASCRELADDLRRWLRGEPVQAIQRTRAERAVSWAMRHPAISGLSLALVVVAVISLAIVIRQSRKTDIVRADLGGQIAMAQQEKQQQVAQLEAKLTEQEQMAAEQEVAARQQAAALELEREQKRRSAYARSLLQISQLASDKPDEACAMLDDASTCPEDLRDFTWHYLRRRCTAERTRFEAGRSPVLLTRFAPLDTSLLIVSADDQRGAAGRGGFHVQVWDPSGTRQRADLGILFPIFSGGRGAATDLLDALCLRFSPDGKRLAVRRGEDGIDVWNCHTGELERHLAAGSSVTAIAMSNAATEIAVADTSRTITFFDIETGEVRDHIDAPKLEPAVGPQDSMHRASLVNILGLDFSGNAEYLLCVGSANESSIVSNAMQVWKRHAAQWSPLTDVTNIQSVRFMADPMLLVQRDTALELWNLAKEEKVSISEHSNTDLPEIAAAENGSVLVAFQSQRVEGGNDTDFESIGSVWDVTSQNKLGEIRTREPLTAFARHSNLMATVQSRWSSPSVTIWELPAVRQVAHFDLSSGGSSPHLDAVALTDDGAYLACRFVSAPARGSAEARVVVWNARTGEQILAEPTAYEASALSSDARKLALASDHTVRLLDLRFREPAAAALKHDAGLVSVLQFTADTNQLVVWPNGAMGVGLERIELVEQRPKTKPFVWNPANGTVARLEIPGQDDSAILVGNSQAVAYSDGISGRMAPASASGRVTLWKLSDGPVPEDLGAFSDIGTPLALSQDDRWLATFAGGQLVVWDLTTRTPQSQFVYAGQPQRGASSSETWYVDGEHLVVCSEHRLQMWNWARDGMPVTFTEHMEPKSLTKFPASVAWSHDRQWFCAARRLGGLGVWNTAEPMNPAYQIDQQGQAALSPDGTTVLIYPDAWSAGMTLDSQHADAAVRTIAVWDLKAGTMRWTATTRAPIQWAGFSPDGQLCVTAGGENGKSGELRFWDSFTGTERPAPIISTGALVSAAFSLDGSSLAALSADRTIHLWSASPTFFNAPPHEDRQPENDRLDLTSRPNDDIADAAEDIPDDVPANTPQGSAAEDNGAAQDYLQSVIRTPEDVAREFRRAVLAGDMAAIDSLLAEDVTGPLRGLRRAGSRTAALKTWQKALKDRSLLTREELPGENAGRSGRASPSSDTIFIWLRHPVAERLNGELPPVDPNDAVQLIISTHRGVHIESGQLPK